MKWEDVNYQPTITCKIYVKRRGYPEKMVGMYYSINQISAMEEFHRLTEIIKDQGGIFISELEFVPSANITLLRLEIEDYVDEEEGEVSAPDVKSDKWTDQSHISYG